VSVTKERQNQGLPNKKLDRISNTHAEEGAMEDNSEIQKDQLQEGGDAEDGEVVTADVIDHSLPLS
jgi:hypothetical protein